MKTKKKKKTASRAAPYSRVRLGFAITLLCLCAVFLVHPWTNGTKSRLESLRPLVEQYAEQYDIEDHMDELMAILAVESGGDTEDVFQSSESLGLPPNSLNTKESIDQGCKYYSQILAKAAELGVNQDAAFQAYNYGMSYLTFIAENGGVHTDALAQEFSRLQSNGKIVSYPNPVAIARNGGWRYDYGNMFYVDLIHQNL